MNKLQYCFCLLALVAAACDDDDYTKAPVPASDNIGAYFPSSNKTQVLRGEDEEKSFSVEVGRTNSQGKVTIPITVLSQTQNIVIPDSVTFKDGEAFTNMAITYTDLQTTPKCELAIDDAYCNPYKKKDGSTRTAFNVYKLNLVCDSILVDLYNGSTDDFFSGVNGQAIYQMGQDNRFVWKNFLGSGIDMQFKIDGHFDATDPYKCYGDFIPLNNYQEDDYGWYLMNDEDGADSENYTKWVPEGCESDGIYDWIYFYYKYQGSSYFYVDFRKTAAEDFDYSWGYISSAVLNISKNYQSYYIYFYYYY